MSQSSQSSLPEFSSPSSLQSFARTATPASRRLRRRVDGSIAIHRAVTAAANYACERLERRQLLSTTLTGGGDFNGVPQEEAVPYEYLDGRQLAVRISMLGDITASFTFAHVATSGAINFSNLISPTQGNVSAAAGADLFHIDIISAAPDASISIARVALPNTTGAPRPMLPFGSFGASFTVNNAQPGTSPIAVTPDGGTGAILLGALGYTSPPGGGTPTQTDPLAEIGDVTAGLTVPAGVNMNRFFFGGTILGRVDIGGSIDTFYAGQILTGEAEGISQGAQVDISELQRNFNVSGDIANLITAGTIGTTSGASGTPGAERYETGFRLSVNGHIGEVQTGGNATSANFLGSVIVSDNVNFTGTGRTQIEEEGDVGPLRGDVTAFEGNGNANLIDSGVPTLADSEANFNNDSPQNAQLLGTLFSSALGHRSIELNGALNGLANVGDFDDFYGVALDGGQTVNFTLTPTDLSFTGLLSIGIFSPEAINNPNGLLLSSFDRRNSFREANQTLTLTTKEPGIYYIAVGFLNDAAFNGNSPNNAPGEVDYHLAVTGVGEMAIGGLKASGYIDFPGDVAAVQQGGSVNPSLSVERGDIGAVLAGSDILAGGTFGGDPSSITAAAGNLRVLQAGNNIGKLGTVGFYFSPTLSVSRNVGLVRTGGLMLLNGDLNSSVGGSYQLLDAGTVMESNLSANAAIGTIRAQSVGTNDFAPVWRVNADSKGTDGVIDLISVTGDAAGVGTFGTLQTGGPQISTGPGGNVRYMSIAPTVDVFNDNFFGGTEDQVIHYAAGAAAALTDDSGTPITFFPTKARSNIAGDLSTTSTGTGTTTTGGSSTSAVTAGTLSALTYGIRDKGGVVLINLTETAGNIEVTAASTTTTGTTGTVTAPVVSVADAPVSLSASTSAAGANGSVDIGMINLVGAGEASTFDPNTRKFTTTAGTGFLLPEDMSISLTGRSPINVWNTVGSQNAELVDAANIANTRTPTLAGMGTVSNATSGEMVNLQAEDIVTLSAQTIGIAKSSTASSVGGDVLIDSAPFERQRTLVQIGGAAGDPTTGIGGNAQTIQARGGLGNIIVAGNLGNVLANSDKVKTAGRIDGIVAPVVVIDGTGASAVITTTAATSTTTAATTTSTSSILSGNLLNVNIGQGLGFAGTGDFAQTGLFASNFIGNITNQGSGSDIRGDVVSTADHGGLPAQTIISTITGLPIPSTAVHGAAINAINLTEGGSLINARVFVVTTFAQVLQTSGTLTIPELNNGNLGAATQFDIGTISLSGNGGILGTEFQTGGINTITVDGFGMINSIIGGENADQINSITLGGYGLRSSIITGQNSVGSIKLTGTGKQIPVTEFTPSVRQSETGSLVDSFSTQPLDGSNDLDLFLAVTKAKPKRKGATEAGVIADTNITGTDRLGSLTAYRMIGHVAPAATTIKQQLAQLIAATPAMTLSFAQAIGKIQIKESTTRANITTGDLKSFDTGLNIVSTNVTTTGNIAEMSAGFFSGSTHINATGPDGTITYLKSTLGFNAAVNASVSIGEISVGTDLNSLLLDTSGNFNELLVKGSIGRSANVRVANTLNVLNVKHNVLGGAAIQAKKIGTQIIGGQVFGNIVITG